MALKLMVCTYNNASAFWTDKKRNGVQTNPVSLPGFTPKPQFPFSGLMSQVHLGLLS